jgi:hypothetical protein
MSDQHGQASAVSIVVRIRRLGTAWFRLLFFGSRHLAYVTNPIKKQQFIHFCHWMVLTHVPDQKGSRRRLSRPVLWFESNYDGDVFRYMDTFTRIIPWRQRAAWLPTDRFPDISPPGPFHQWTLDNVYETTHYWCAYPDATTRDVGRSLRVDEAFAQLPSPDAVSPEEFRRAWLGFLTARQGDL